MRCHLELAWKIAVVDHANKRGDKLVCCRTESLECVVTRFQLELLSKLGNEKNRALTRFRKHFDERKPDYAHANAIATVLVDRYWEDDSGQQISDAEAYERLYKIPKDSVRIVDTAPHYVKWQISLANGEPPFGEALSTPTSHQVNVLRRFTLDAWELKNSKFLAQGGAFSLSGSTDTNLQLHVADPESVNHYLAVFRRLYGEGEKANYTNVCDTTAVLVPGSPFSHWIAAERKKLKQYLGQAAHFWPLQQNVSSFNVSQLISNFMYGRFLHQSRAEHEGERARWAIEAGSADLLEATFYNAIMRIGRSFVDWGQWTARLCIALGINLMTDSQGNKIIDPYLNRDLRLDRLSKEHRETFETLAAELAAELREADTDRQSFSYYLVSARNHLIDVL